MLTSITLKNYTTFIKETTFDFKSTNYKILDETNVGENRVLKGALFIGENASGKTQVLNAIVLLLDLLLINAEQNLAIKKSLYTKGKKFSLTYTFDIHGNNIKYSIILEDNSINSEKLYMNNELKLERLQNNGKTYFGEENDNNEVASGLSLLRLEYYSTRFNNNPILNEWYEFLKNSLYMNCLLGGRAIKIYNPTRIEEQSIYRYAQKNNASKLNKFIEKLGYNSEIVFYDMPADASISINPNKKKIGLKKNGTDVIIPIELESTGNKAFIDSILPIIFATKNNCMIIIDEFSSGLHNELEESLIKYFFNNSKNSQIFFTSHSTNLLDTSILRPDQIYSFKFDSKEGTIIKRFSDENPRESQNIEKMYLNGVFDGMPKYNKAFKD